jgi:CHASE3 domain
MPRILITRANIASAFLFAAVPLAFLAAITSYQLFKNVPDARLAREDTKQTFLVVRSANAVAEAIQDGERGQRGYLIGRESYLEPYNSAKKHLPQLLGSGRKPAGAATQAAHPPGRSDGQNERIGRDHRNAARKRLRPGNREHRHRANRDGGHRSRY